jgi:O-antigen ligase
MDGLTSRAEVVTVVRRLLYCATFMVVIGSLQFYGFDLTQSVRIPGLVVNSEAVVGIRSNFNRPYGTALHPIEYGVVAGALVPLAYWIARLDGRLRFKLIIAALAFAAMSSVSRSSVLAIGVAMIVLLLGVPMRQRLVLLGAGAVFVGVVGATVNGLVGTLRSLFTTAKSDPSVTARVQRTPKVLKLISEHPYFGRGAGTYNIETYFLLDNELQKVTIETGFIGLAVLVLFIGLVSVVAWRTRLGAESGRLPGTALAATILGIFISTYTFDAFYYRILTGVLYLCIGLVGAMHRVTAVEREQAADAWFDARRNRAEARERTAVLAR